LFLKPFFYRNNETLLRKQTIVVNDWLISFALLIERQCCDLKNIQFLEKTLYKNRNLKKIETAYILL
jgi:hypothetical protein